MLIRLFSVKILSELCKIQMLGIQLHGLNNDVPDGFHFFCVYLGEMLQFDSYFSDGLTLIVETKTHVLP